MDKAPATAASAHPQQSSDRTIDAVPAGSTTGAGGATRYPPGPASLSRPAAAIRPPRAAVATSSWFPPDESCMPEPDLDAITDTRLWQLAVDTERRHQPGPDGHCILCLPATRYPCRPRGLAEVAKQAARRRFGLPLQRQRDWAVPRPAMTARRPPPAWPIPAGGNCG